MVKGYPTWDDAPWDISTDLRYHEEEDDYAFLQGLFDLTNTTYVFPDLATAAGPSTHSFGNLDFCRGWQHPLGMMTREMRGEEALLARVISGAKPTGLLVGSDADAERWAAAARAAGLEALVWRDLTTKVWIAPARLGERVNRRALRATWHAVAAGDPDLARANRLLDVIDRGLEQAFAVALQQPVQRGTIMQPPWWDDHSDEGFVALGAVLGYAPSTTYARLTDC